MTIIYSSKIPPVIIRSMQCMRPMCPNYIRDSILHWIAMNGSDCHNYPGGTYLVLPKFYFGNTRIPQWQHIHKLERVECYIFLHRILYSFNVILSDLLIIPMKWFSRNFINQPEGWTRKSHIFLSPIESILCLLINDLYIWEHSCNVV